MSWRRRKAKKEAKFLNRALQKEEEEGKIKTKKERRNRETVVTFRAHPRERDRRRRKKRYRRLSGERKEKGNITKGKSLDCLTGKRRGGRADP